MNEQRYIIEVNNGAKVNMKGFTTTGTAGTNCDDIMELVFWGAILKLNSAIVNSCTGNGVLRGPGSSGYAIITKTYYHWL